MTWIALSDAETRQFQPRGLHGRADVPELIGRGDDDLMVRGTLVFETRLPNAAKPRTLLRYDRGGDWPFHLSLQAIPGGGLILIMNQGGSIIHQTLNVADGGRLDVLRLSFAWDAPARAGWLALEHDDREYPLLIQTEPPSPMRAGDLRTLFLQQGGDVFAAPELVYMALSSKIEPVGPLPSLMPDTPIATPQGYRPLNTLRRGDTVVSGSGDIVPVLHKVTRTVPARGGYRPFLIRAPYFGLQQDVHVAPSQRLRLDGSEVEYLFGKESVLASAKHLTGGHSVRPARCGLTATYSQLLLPDHETVLAAGATVASLYIGRLHRKPLLLAASVLAGLDRHSLPDHGRCTQPVLRAFDARILAESRVA